MNDTEEKNAIIKGTRISTDDGVLMCWLDLDYGGTGQGFGSFALYLPKTYQHHSIMSLAGHHLFRCMEIAGVSRWDDIKGRSIRVKASHCEVSSIGHIINDDWYCPKDDFAKVDTK